MLSSRATSIQILTTTYDFEALGSNNTTFTSNGINFSLTGYMIGQSFTQYGSRTPPSNGCLCI